MPSPLWHAHAARKGSDHACPHLPTRRAASEWGPQAMRLIPHPSLPHPTPCLAAPAVSGSLRVAWEQPRKQPPTSPRRHRLFLRDHTRDTRGADHSRGHQTTYGPSRRGGNVPHAVSLRTLCRQWCGLEWRGKRGAVALSRESRWRCRDGGRREGRRGWSHTASWAHGGWAQARVHARVHAGGCQHVDDPDGERPGAADSSSGNDLGAGIHLRHV